MLADCGRSLRSEVRSSGNRYQRFGRTPGRATLWGANSARFSWHAPSPNMPLSSFSTSPQPTWIKSQDRKSLD